MALSSLQAQLAALNGSAGKNPGLAYSSSRRHTDAVGRGLHFSVQTGHTLKSDQAKFKASLIYPSAKEAADVPLTTLEENCMTALRDLSEIHPPILSLATSICGKEAAVPSILQQALLQLTSLLGEARADMDESCLHILEYMIRRYDVHLKMMEAFVWTLLPHSERLPGLFHRCLQLVDLASNQSYLWLRPYAQPNKVQPVPRQLVAQQVVKSDLMQTLCQQTSAVVYLHPKDTDLPRKGIAHVLSYSAAVLIQGLAWQVTLERLAADRETMLRTLLPYVLKACASRRCVDWSSWGYVLATVLVETLPLAPSTIETITVAMLRAAVEDGNADEWALDALAAVVAMLVPASSSKSKSETYLPLLQNKLLGCDVPHKTLELLVNWAAVPELLGRLHSDRRLAVAPLLASLVTSQRSAHLSVALVLEEGLTSLWKDSRLDLVASTAAWLVGRYASDSCRLDEARRVLEALHRKDVAACERGVALGVETAEGQVDKLSSLLQDIVILKYGEKVGDTTELLPPRVALEHPDAAVRLKAIQRLAAMDWEDEASTESLLGSLLRRWSADDDVAVAYAASSLIVEQLDSGVQLSFVGPENGVTIVEWVLDGLNHWIHESTLQASTATLDLAKKSLLLAGHVALELEQWTESPDLSVLWQPLLELVASCADGNGVKQSAEEALGVVLAEASTSSMLSLSRNGRFLRGLRDLFSKAVGPNPDDELVTRRRCVRIMLRTISDASSDEAPLPRVFNELALLALQSIDPSRQRGEDVANALKALHLATDRLEHVPSKALTFVLSVASVDSDAVYDKVAVPIVTRYVGRVKDGQRVPVSEYSVLLEMAHRPTVTDKVTARLVSLAAKLASSKTGQGKTLAVIPALALIEHSNHDVRMASLGLLEAVGASLDKTSILRGICEGAVNLRGSVQVGGVGTLSRAFTAWISGAGNASAARETVLSHIILASLACGEGFEMPEAFQHNWLPLGEALGGFRIASIILDAAERAGEDTFPLLVRWRFAGSRLFNLRLSARGFGLKDQGLQESVVRMLKGITVEEGRVAFTSGPSSGGGRARSYSVGNGNAVVASYPPEMSDAVVAMLSEAEKSAGTREVASLVFRTVVCSRTWGAEVFQKLPKKTRSTLARSILAYTTTAPDASLASLPFDDTDIIDFFEDEGFRTKNFGLKSVIVDFIRANVGHLAKSRGGQSLIDALFDELASASKYSGDDQDGADFVVQSIILALVQLHEHAGFESYVGRSNLSSLSDTLLGLLGATTEAAPEVRALVSARARDGVLVLIAGLCSRFPDHFVTTITPILVSTVTRSEHDFSTHSMANRTFEVLLPVFQQHAEATENSLAGLLGTVVKSVQAISDDTAKIRYYVDFASALQIGETREKGNSAAVAALIAMIVAQGVYGGTDDSTDTVSVARFVVDFLCRLPVLVQVATTLSLLGYAREGIAAADNNLDSSLEGRDFMGRELLLKAGESRLSSTTVEKIKLYSYTGCLLRVFRDIVASDRVRKYIGKSQSADTRLSLRLWQELLVLQSSVLVVEAKGPEEPELLEATISLADECREILQSALPLHIFLASLSTLLQPGTARDVQVRALSLLGDKASVLDSNSPEAVLFAEILPSVVDILVETGGDSLLKQAALVSLETIGRVLGSTSSSGFAKKRAPGFEMFVLALDRCAKILRHCENNLTFTDEGSTHALVSSVALCSATLVRAVQASALPFLTSILKSLISALASANNCVMAEPGSKDHVDGARVTQLAVLRSLIAIGDTVPQFLSSHLMSLLDQSTLLSKALRCPPNAEDDNAGIQSALANFDKVISNRVPVRLLLPAVSNAMKRLSDATEMTCLLHICKSCVEQSSSSEVVSHKNALLSTITVALGLDEFENLSLIIDDACDLLHAVVLKLSEVQLRRLFVSLWEWRGEFDPTKPDERALRRYAFWKAAARLSKDLRSIFLPCFDVVENDVTAELCTAVKSLAAQRESEAVEGGKKKRRLSPNAPPLRLESMRAIQPLLLCLELTLRADAHEGGTWIRADENKRYETFLEPLGNLLQVYLPSSFPVPATTQKTSSAFQIIVQGVVLDEGSVVGCLTALAAAGGNERLWKPLNHAVLEACGNETRAEVRKAGVFCLLSLVKSLGEEYMVLLPECLPVLSELLEESDEEIAGLAREIVTMAEDLLGESLEDSLR